MTATDIPLCGARRPGWERPGQGRHRLPCVLEESHKGGHRDACGHAWPQQPPLTECGAPPPGASTLACLRTAGHDGPHRNITDREWAGACERCGLTEQPHATVTTDSGGSVRHRQLCQRCARGEASAGVRRAVRRCVRCDRITDTPVLVSEVHQNSGPGFNVYACCDCAPRFPPLPDALDLLRARHPGAGTG